ncbi:MAG: hypothetical protein ATN35_00950 [Epulopiscium sp. Nele67-Bin004]|nr:MAG: hypothetical protein ATN35_00950 [Epulopiscium sp. Nele67-Bin004]
MEKMVIREKRLEKNAIRVEWAQIILCVCAFMFARVCIESEYYTLGVAYLGTLHRQPKARRWCGLFAILGYVSVAIFNSFAMNYLIIVGFIVVFRSMMERAKIKFNLVNQMVIISVSLFVVKAVNLVLTGFSVVGVIENIVECMVACLLMYVLDFGVGALLEHRQYMLTQKEAISMILMFVGILAGTIDFYMEVPVFTEIYFRDIAVYVFLTAMIYLGGVNIGVTISVVIGAVLTLINYIPMNFSFIYSMASMFGGVLVPMGKIGVIFGMGLGQIIGFIIFNAGVIDMPLIGAFLVSSLISIMIPNRYFGLANWFKDKRVEDDEKVHMMHIQEIVASRLDHFRKAFFKLGKSFQDEQYRTATLDRQKIDIVLEDTINKMCEDCGLRKHCWEYDAEQMYKMSVEMIEAGQRNGKIVRGDIPEPFKIRCKMVESFAALLNFRLDLVRQDVYYENRVIETKMLMGQQMEAVAESINTITQEIAQEVVFNKELERLIAETLNSVGIIVVDIILLEKEENLKVLELRTKACQERPDTDVIRTLEKVLGIRLEVQNHICGEKVCYYSIIPKQRFGVMAGAAICAKGNVCGDVHSFMQLENGKYLMAVADGMGSGEVARKESKVTIEMLEEFMEAGLTEEVALKIINSSLVLRMDNEVFSTIDVTIIDTSTGVAKLLKAGAATTFVLRGDEVITIRSHSLPVGIIKDVDIETHVVQLEYGDTIVMVTDGLLSTTDDALGREEAFKQFIIEEKCGDPVQLANYLLERSRKLLAGEYSDDMTVVVGRIWEKLD